MRRSFLAVSLGVGLALLPTQLRAQRVSAELVAFSRPAITRVVVAERPLPPIRHRTVLNRRAPVRRGYLVVGPRLIVVERFRSIDRRRNHWRRGYRLVTVYYFGGRYYDRFDQRHPGKRVLVYQRDGRCCRDE